MMQKVNVKQIKNLQLFLIIVNFIKTNLCYQTKSNWIMNIDCLKHSPIFDKRACLFIEPLAPLSLVTSMPGAYYRTQREPTKFMIFGLLENLLGWHFPNEGGEKIRDKIIKSLCVHHKKVNKIDLKFEKTPVGFKPLLQHHIKIDNLFLKPFVNTYEDYWTQHLRDEDERHAKGTRNYDYRHENEVNQIYTLPKDDRNAKWQNLFNKNKEGLFPVYYQSPTKREFIVVEGKYGYPIATSEVILDTLIEAKNELAHPLYLGTSEGWLHLNIEKI
jgi:CRISPR-associated protein Cas5